MWSYHPDLLAKPVPRYTSYPTAMEFAEDVGTDDYAQALDAVEPATPISLYVHIPFCESICWYCGCNTGAAGRKQRLDDYLAALRTEIALVAKRLGGRGRVRRIAFGGGSRSEEHTSEHQSLMRISYSVFCLKKKKKKQDTIKDTTTNNKRN